MMRSFLSVFLMLFLCFSSYSSYAAGASAGSVPTDGSSSDADYDASKDPTNQIICNILRYIWQFGGPLITVVIIGSAILAIFGKMQWSALVALAIFTGVFFGATKIVQVFTEGITFAGGTGGAAKTIYYCGKV